MEDQDLEKILRRVMKKSAITPHVFFECLVPIARDVRPAAKIHLTQLSRGKIEGISRITEQKWFRDIVETIEDNLGVSALTYMDAIALERGFPSIMIYKDGAVREKVEGMDVRYRISRDLLSQQYDEGLLLGIPECCVSDFISKSCQYISPDIVLMESLRKRLESADSIRNLPLRELAVFWALEVIPCSLSCENARKIGYKTLNCFGDERIKRMYIEVIMAHNATTAYFYDRKGEESKRKEAAGLNYFGELNRDILNFLKTH